MLCLDRKIGESIRIGDSIELKVIEVRGGKVRIRVEAPQSVRIERGEKQCQKAT